MASLSFDQKKNRWRIQFLAVDGSRQSIGIKGTRARDKGQAKATALRNHIEELAISVRSGTVLDFIVQRWIDSIDSNTYQKMVKAGFLRPRQVVEVPTLGPFLVKWFADRRGTVEHSTELTWRHVQRNLIACFGEDRTLESITQEDTEQFVRWLQTEEDLSTVTRTKRHKIARQMFASAVKAKKIEQNPFGRLEGAKHTNKQRQHFFTIEETAAILDGCSSQEWRVLIALARYGGLRVPSEIKKLRWSDINWQAKSFIVHSPKLKRYEDKAVRVVPLFPELESELNLLWDELGDGPAEFVLPTIRATTNIGTTINRAIERAGLGKIQKPAQNMRATRATELEKKFGGQSANVICGHSEKVAAEAYRMRDGADILEIAGWCTGGANRVQQGGANGRNEQTDPNSRHEKTPVFPGFAGACSDSQSTPLGLEGLEPTTNEL